MTAHSFISEQGDQQPRRPRKAGQKSVYLTALDQLAEQLRAMLAQGDNLPPEELAVREAEVTRIKTLIRQARQRAEVGRAQAIPIEEPFDGV